MVRWIGVQDARWRSGMILSRKPLLKCCAPTTSSPFQGTIYANQLWLNNFLPLRVPIYADPLWPNNFLPLRGRIEVGVLRRSRFSGDAGSWSAVPRHRFESRRFPVHKWRCSHPKQHWEALRRNSRAAPRCRTPGIAEGAREFDPTGPLRIRCAVGGDGATLRPTEEPAGTGSSPGTAGSC